MTKRIITISREFGSGGKQIGQQIAKRLGISFYDKERIETMVKEDGYAAKVILDRQQRLTDSLLYNLAMGKLQGLSSSYEPQAKELSLSEKVFLAQRKAIEDIAKKESCVLVGRCGDYILKSRPDVLRIFIYADRDIRKRKVVGEYGELKEHIEEILHEHDRDRRIHYETHTNQRWGDRENFDLLLNSGSLGIGTCVELVCRMLE